MLGCLGSDSSLSLCSRWLLVLLAVVLVPVRVVVVDMAQEAVELEEHMVILLLVLFEALDCPYYSLAPLDCFEFEQLRALEMDLLN